MSSEVELIFSLRLARWQLCAITLSGPPARSDMMVPMSLYSLTCWLQQQSPT
jgi:hypothetical protein